MDRLEILYAVCAFYLILMGFVLGQVWRLKVSTFMKIIISLVTMLFAPGGLIWFLLEERKDKKPKKKLAL